MARILTVLGHPRTDSFCGALANAYDSAARKAGAEVLRLNVTDLDFDAVADVTYWSEDWDASSLEPDLEAALHAVRATERLVPVFPLWWGSMPALFKGFFDRLFSVPGFGVEYGPNGRPVPLLKGRRATLIVSHDAPVLWERYFMHNRGIGVLRHSILGLCGVRTDRVHQFGPMLGSTDEKRKGWIEEAAKAGDSDARR